MASKATKPTNDELLAQFDDLGIDTTPNPSTAVNNNNNNTKPEAQQDDILAELDSLATQRTGSGPGTPGTSTEHRSATRSPKPSVTATPSSGRSSEDKPAAARKSEESVPQGKKKSVEFPRVPVSEQPAASREQELHQEAQGGGGGWWGGFFATASAAMKQAEAAVKEIQKNEEAQKWAQQVKGNVGALRELVYANILGGELRSMAIPTFTSLIHTLAPPISSHERLQIHVTHDLSGYPSVDPLIYAVFSRVMSQVEGGDLLVIQQGQESAPKGHHQASSPAGWRDGPWWRTVTPGNPRTISAVRGTVEATKLARASAESYASEYFASRGGVEEAAKQASQVLSESNPVRNSDIFLAIQAVTQAASTELFQAGPTADNNKAAAGVVEVADKTEDEVAFALYLHDPIHGIAFHTLSQTLPQRWIDWLDAPAPAATESEEDDDAWVPRTVVPEAIAEIIESGGVDPREWVAEWIEESLSLAIGVIAQRYVARRMGVGEGGFGKGKMRAEKATVLESGAGEAARAI
ncbi:hypothetical protein ASPZODRAFT_165802 [Penicilliopsis zonata CBS 506.65]|uniref:Maintenance of telomere capping protein 1 n=1 Tax=Penicilliopsis zonata CBS 506.65 TaxID=1073090 RepID=A0A1L9SKR5_9EURO|nr:hypothetical protein ASPZODRAFT_165802 [Penicilliopsis zonata CBS 506.65]OJJ47691.1 hypothetical protein ASPZODRAFT_165802 [Penicilliopsis zonata CBS 506.65]